MTETAGQLPEIPPHPEHTMTWSSLERACLERWRDEVTCAAITAHLSEQQPQDSKARVDDEAAQREKRYNFLIGFLIERGVLTDRRYGNGTWSLQGIYGVDDSGLRGAGTTPEEALDNAIIATNLDPVAARKFWSETHASIPPAQVADTDLVLRITTAYEQGFGHADRAELSNPYAAGSVEHEAWDHGREEGQQRAAQAAGEPGALERCAGCDIPNGCPEYCWCKPEAMQAAAQPEAVPDVLLTALRFYARQEHYNYSDEDEFDTVSGEPQNWLCHHENSTMIEDGTVARLALRGVAGNWMDDDEDETPQPIEGEAFAATTPHAGERTTPAEPAMNEQALFEREMQNRERPCLKDADGDYVSPNTAMAWEVWQMARAAAPEVPAILRNSPTSALAIRYLVGAGHVTQEAADWAFTVACSSLENEAKRMNVELPWVVRASPPLPAVPRSDA